MPFIPDEPIRKKPATGFIPDEPARTGFIPDPPDPQPILGRPVIPAEPPKLAWTPPTPRPPRPQITLDRPIAEGIEQVLAEPYIQEPIIRAPTPRELAHPRFLTPEQERQVAKRLEDREAAAMETPNQRKERIATGVLMDFVVPTMITGGVLTAGIPDVAVKPQIASLIRKHPHLTRYITSAITGAGVGALQQTPQIAEEMESIVKTGLPTEEFADIPKEILQTSIGFALSSMVFDVLGMGAQAALMRKVEYITPSPGKVIPIERLKQIQGGAPKTEMEQKIFDGERVEYTIPREWVRWIKDKLVRPDVPPPKTRALRPYVYQTGELERLLKRDEVFTRKFYQHATPVVAPPTPVAPKPYAEDIANIPALARKVVAGETMTPDDLQLQANFPRALGEELVKVRAEVPIAPAVPAPPPEITPTPPPPIAEPPVKRPVKVSPYEYQDTHQEHLAKTGFESGETSAQLEAGGDIFRELTRAEPDLAYIKEKVNSINRYWDRFDIRTDTDKENLSLLREQWQGQPTETTEQQKAKELNLAIIDRDKKKVDSILSEVVRPDVAEVRPKDVAPLPKEAWEMTRDEFVNLPRVTPMQHEISVRTALAEGKPVPPEVLKDYPDLAREVPAVPERPIPPRVAEPTPQEPEIERDIELRQVEKIPRELMVEFKGLEMPVPPDTPLPGDELYRAIKDMGGIAPHRKDIYGRIPEKEEYKDVPLPLRRVGGHPPDIVAQDLYNLGLLARPSDNELYKQLKTLNEQRAAEKQKRQEIKQRTTEWQEKLRRLALPEETQTKIINLEKTRGITLETSKANILELTKGRTDELVGITKDESNKYISELIAKPVKKIKRDIFIDETQKKRIDRLLKLYEVDDEVLQDLIPTITDDKQVKPLEQLTRQEANRLILKLAREIPIVRERMAFPPREPPPRDPLIPMRPDTPPLPLEEHIPKVLTPVFRATVEQDAINYGYNRRYGHIVDRFNRAKLFTNEVGVKLHNFIENPQLYPLDENIINAVGADTIKSLKELRTELTRELKEKGIIDSVFDEDTYIRTFLVTLDGGKPTAEQIRLLSQGSDASLKNRLLGIKIGTDGKTRYDLERIYKDADERDVVLRPFGLKTNRNFFETFHRYLRDTSISLGNKGFIQSLRDSAKKGLRGVVEYYDPAEYALFKETLYDRAAAVRTSILDTARRQKKITEADYQAAKANASIQKEKMKFDLSLENVKITEFHRQQMKEIDLWAKLAKAVMFDDMKVHKAELDHSASIEIEQLKHQAIKELSAKNENILKKYAEFTDKGYVAPYTRGIPLASQMTGLLFTRPQARAIEKVLTTLQPSNVEDGVRALKSFIATGDLFQLPEIVRQSFAARGVAGLKEMLGIGIDAPSIEKSVDWVRHGLRLARPVDVDIDIFNQAVNRFETDNKSLVADLAERFSATMERVPVAGAAVRAARALEHFQWSVALPTVKERVADGMYADLRKKPKFKDWSDEELKVMVARTVNDLFQGLNWRALMAEDTVEGRILNKSIERVSRIVFFGSDRLLSVIHRNTRGFHPETGGLYRAFIIRKILASIVILQVLQHLMTGRSTLENQVGNELDLELPFIKDEKGNPLSVNILGTWAEPARALFRPGRYIRGKRGVLPAILGVGVADIHAPKNIKEFVWQHKPIPFSIQTILDQLAQDPKLKFGETTFPIAAGRALSEFAGVPTSFRSRLAQQREHNLFDLIAGRSDIFQYAITTKKDTATIRKQKWRDTRRKK